MVGKFTRNVLFKTVSQLLAFLNLDQVPKTSLQTLKTFKIYSQQEQKLATVSEAANS